MSTFFHGIQYAALYILLTTGICFLVAGEEQRWSREEHTRIAWILAYFSVGTCFYLVLNKLFEIMIPHVKGTEIDGFPRWRWWLASFGEAVILNLCMLQAYRESVSRGWSFSQWLYSDASDLGKAGCVSHILYMTALYASQARDMLPPPKDCPTKLIVHHYAVMICVTLYFYVGGGAGNIFLFYSWLMEQGSMFYNMFNLHQTSTFWFIVYQISMVLSNVLSLYGAYDLYNTETQMWSKITYCFTTVGVSIGRQLHAYNELSGKKHTHKSKKQ